MRPELARSIQKPEEQWRIGAGGRWQVKNKVGENHRSAPAMEEHDLVENRGASEDMLLEPLTPQIRRYIGQHRIEFDVSALLREAWCAI
jgi:hypothetical protein